VQVAGIPLKSTANLVAEPVAARAGRPRLFYGWAIVGVLAVTSALTMAMGALNFGLFIKPIGSIRFRLLVEDESRNPGAKF
jgi:hypothetical protein